MAESFKPFVFMPDTETILKIYIGPWDWRQIGIRLGTKHVIYNN